MNDFLAGILDVPDFPKVGIVFKDLTPLLADPRLFPAAVEAIVDPFRSAGIAKVVGIEARGFMFGAAAALALSAGFVPARKPGKLPRRHERVDYALEYGSDALEMHVDDVEQGQLCLIVDDVLATGGTARAAVELVRRCGGAVAGLSVFLELELLEGRRKLPEIRVESVVLA